MTISAKGNMRRRQVFVIVPSIEVNNKNDNIAQVVKENWAFLSEFLLQHPVFFSKIEANDYNVYSLRTRKIVPVYLPEEAICSRNSSLSIDQNWLTLENFLPVVTPRMRSIFVENATPFIEIRQDKAPLYETA